MRRPGITTADGGEDLALAIEEAASNQPPSH
jgi:hypothetical protein